jgi:hypothetical protein
MFIAQALRREIGWHEQELRRTDLTDDERSDLTNDLHYLRALLEDLEPA